MHVLIGLDGHELIDPHAAGLAYAPQVVALQIDEHDVFGALLRVRSELRHLARSSPGRRLRGRVPAIGRVSMRRPMTRTRRSGDELRIATPCHCASAAKGAGLAAHRRP